MAGYNQDILALLDSMPYEVRKDPTTARKIAELVAAKAAAKQEASVRYQENSAEMNERMFKPQMDEQAEPQPEAPHNSIKAIPLHPAPEDVAAVPNIGELM